MAQKLDRAEFGPNTWLIDEMHRAYVDNPDSVGEAWREFFADYQPRTPLRQAAAPTATPPPPAPPPVLTPLPPDLIPMGAEGTDGESPTEALALRGPAAVQVDRMEESLGVPTATSIRTVPARLLEVNRTVLNAYLQRTGGGKVSFTHLIGWAVARALADVPAMNSVYKAIDGKPHMLRSPHVNLGLAVDVRKADGTRALMVPNIRGAESLDFAEFFAAYEDLIRKVTARSLRPDDFAGTTVTITNPGTIGTMASVPRLMAGQAAIIGVGAIDYPAEFAGADEGALAELGVGKVLTLTSTYDHRVIQGAESGEFLRRVQGFLVGDNGFYEDVFRSMGAPYVPVAWRRDVNPPADSLEARAKHGRVRSLINMYRVRGHLMADLDPLAAKPPEMHPELDPATYGFTIWDLDRRFLAAGLAGKDELTLNEILTILLDAYCRRSSPEYMHTQEPAQKQWIQEHVEGVNPVPDPGDMRHILEELSEAEAFERFMHTKYVGHKRFSLEGAESLIPMLDAILDDAADAGLTESVIGMSHRGRLNVLANIVGKSYGQIFREFEGDIDPAAAHGSGDVQYHTGAAGEHASRGGNRIGVTVAPNPSHLESVDPVVEGMVRAKLDLLDRVREAPVLPLLIHGDAAFAGQGVVAETLALSKLKGYWTGGTVHIIVNNQLGFTTGPTFGRSSQYASDVAKMIQAPVFHVNGDDPEACVRMARLAFDYRQTFHRDVVIDMWCYRRWGHNEADDPAFTQPLMYRAIEARRSVRKLYTESLVNRGDLSLSEAEQFLEGFRSRLQQAFDETRGGQTPPKIEWRRPAPLSPVPVPTGVGREVLDRVPPGDVQPAPRRARRPDDRRRARTAPHPRRRLRRRAARQPGSPLRLRQPPVGDGGPGLRVRLCRGQPQGPRRLGGPVRRLRRRGTGAHRHLPVVRRGQVGSGQRACPAPAARLRGPGAGPLQRPARTLPPACGRGQHAGRRPVDARPVLPPPAPPGPPVARQAARGDDAEVVAAARDGPIEGRRVHGRLVRRGRRRPSPARRGRQPPHLHPGQDVLRRGESPARAQGPRGHRSYRAALPLPGRGRPPATRDLCGRRAGVGPGGAGEHGGLAVPAVHRQGPPRRGPDLRGP